MNRDTRDKFASGTDQSDLTSGNACWETSPAVLAALNRDFGPFDVDLCADATRHLCPTWLGPGSNHGLHAADALTAPWILYGDTGYCNPPYGAFIAKILPKAKQEAANGFTSVFLIPMRATKAFRQHILRGAAELLFCDKRLIFWENGAPRVNAKTKKPDCALFDSIIVVYRPGSNWENDGPRVSVWEAPNYAEQAPLESYANLLPVVA
jgi:hypothetical protein